MPVKKPATKRARKVGTARYKKRSVKPKNRHINNNANSYHTLDKLNIVTQKGPSPFGDRYQARLPWSWATNFTGSNVPGLLSRLGHYKLGSIYDPDNGLGGKAVQYKDQLSLIYSRYKVNTCHIKLTFTNPSIDGMFVGYRIRTHNDVAVDSVAVGWPDLKKLRNVVMMPMNNTGSQITTMVCNVSLHTLFGMSKSQYIGQDDLGALMSTEPARVSFLEILQVCPMSASPSVYVAIDLIYDVTLSEPISLTISA